MANTKSAAKRARQTVVRTAANRRASSLVKSRLKRARGDIKGGKKEGAVSTARAFFSTVDKAVKSGRVHKNKANRLKSRLNKALVALS